LCGWLDNPHSTQPWRSNLLYEYYWEASFPQTPTTFALRDKQYKLIQYHGIWDIDELYNVADDPRETHNLIFAPEHQARISQLRLALHAQLQKTDGLAIPLGFKANHGSNLRNPSGTKRAEFPAEMLFEQPVGK
jgi:N-acetylglucosamine-6-sulfatase